MKDIKYDKSDIKEAVPENYKETTITYNGVDENGERIEVSRMTEVKTAYTEEDKKQVREYLEGLQKEDPSITDEEIEEIVNKDSTMTFQYIDGVKYDKDISNIKVDVYGSVYGEEEQFFRTEYINAKKQNTISTTTVDDESTKSYKTVKTTLSEQDVITAYNNTGDENVDSVVRSKLETSQENSTLYDDKNRVTYETQKGGVFKTTVIDGGNTERKTGDVLSYGKTDKATSYTYYDDPEDENYGEVETNTVSKEYDYLDRSNQYGEAAKNGIVTVSVTNTKGKFLLETTTESKTYVLGEGTKDKDGKENISTRKANYDIDPVEHTYTYSQSISLGGGLLIDVGEGNSISKETRERILQYIDDLDDEKLKAAALDMTDEQLARLVTSDTYTIFGVNVDFKEGSVSVEENVSTKTIYDAGGNVVSSIKDGGETGGTYTYDLSEKGKEQFGTGVDFSTLSDVNFSASGIFTGKSIIDTAGSSVVGQGKSINDTIISDMKDGTDNVLGDKISFSQYRQDYGYEKDDLGRVTSSKFVENVNGGWIAGETTNTYATENNSTVATSVTSYASVVTDENGNIPRNADGSIKLDSIVTDESTRETKEPQTGLYTYGNVGHNAPIDVSMKGIDQYNALGDIRDAQRMTKDATTNAIWTGAVTALYVAASIALAVVTFGASAVIQLTATSAIMAIMAIAAIPAVYNGMKRGMNAVSVGDTKTAVMEFAFVALDFAVVVGGFMKIATALAESGKELSGILGAAQKIGAKAASVSQAIAESRAGKILKFLSPKTTLSQQAKLISEGAKTSKVFGFLSNSKVLNFVAGLGGTSWGKALDLVGSIARNALIFGINMDIKIPISGKTILPIHHEGLLGLVLNKIGAEELANNEVFQAATTLLTFAPIFNEEFARAKDGAAGTDKTFMESIKGDKTLGELYRESINAFKMNTLGGATTIPGAALNFVTNAFAGSAGMIADITKFNFIVSNGVFGGIKTLVYNTTGVELGETGNGLLDFLFKGSKVYSSAADFMEYSLTSSASMMTNSSMWAFSFMTPVFTTALTPLLQKRPVIGETIRAFNYASESASNQYVSTFLEENVKEELLGHIWDWVPSDEMKEILQECFDDTPDINVNIQNLNTAHSQINQSSIQTLASASSTQRQREAAAMILASAMITNGSVADVQAARQSTAQAILDASSSRSGFATTLQNAGTSLKSTPVVFRALGLSPLGNICQKLGTSVQERATTRNVRNAATQQYNQHLGTNVNSGTIKGIDKQTSVAGIVTRNQGAEVVSEQVSTAVESMATTMGLSTASQQLVNELLSGGANLDVALATALSIQTYTQETGVELSQEQQQSIKETVEAREGTINFGIMVNNIVNGTIPLMQIEANEDIQTDGSIDVEKMTNQELSDYIKALATELQYYGNSIKPSDYARAVELQSKFDAASQELAKAEKYSKSTAEAIKQIIENGKDKPAAQVISELENYKNEEGLSLREKGLRETYADRYIEVLSRDLDVEDQIITGDTVEGIKASTEVRQIFENVGSFSNEQLIQTEVTPNGLDEAMPLIDAAIYSLENSRNYNGNGNEYREKLEQIKESIANGQELTAEQISILKSEYVMLNLESKFNAAIGGNTFRFTTGQRESFVDISESLLGSNTQERITRELATGGGKTFLAAISAALLIANGNVKDGQFVGVFTNTSSNATVLNETMEQIFGGIFEQGTDIKEAVIQLSAERYNEARQDPSKMQELREEISKARVICSDYSTWSSIVASDWASLVSNEQDAEMSEYIRGVLEAEDIKFTKSNKGKYQFEDSTQARQASEILQKLAAEGDSKIQDALDKTTIPLEKIGDVVADEIDFFGTIPMQALATSNGKYYSAEQKASYYQDILSGMSKENLLEKYSDSGITNASSVEQDIRLGADALRTKIEAIETLGNIMKQANGAAITEKTEGVRRLLADSVVTDDIKELMTNYNTEVYFRELTEVTEKLYEQSKKKLGELKKGQSIISILDASLSKFSRAGLVSEMLGTNVDESAYEQKVLEEDNSQSSSEVEDVNKMILDAAEQLSKKYGKLFSDTEILEQVRNGIGAQELVIHKDFNVVEENGVKRVVVINEGHDVKDLSLPSGMMQVLEVKNGASISKPSTESYVSNSVFAMSLFNNLVGLTGTVSSMVDINIFRAMGIEKVGKAPGVQSHSKLFSTKQGMAEAIYRTASLLAEKGIANFQLVLTPNSELSYLTFNTICENIVRDLKSLGKEGFDWSSENSKVEADLAGIGHVEMSYADLVKTVLSDSRSSSEEFAQNIETVKDILARDAGITDTQKLNEIMTNTILFADSSMTETELDSLSKKVQTGAYKYIIGDAYLIGRGWDVGTMNNTLQSLKTNQNITDSTDEDADNRGQVNCWLLDGVLMTESQMRQGAGRIDPFGNNRFDSHSYSKDIISLYSIETCREIDKLAAAVESKTGDSKGVWEISDILNNLRTIQEDNELDALQRAGQQTKVLASQTFGEQKIEARETAPTVDSAIQQIANETSDVEQAKQILQQITGNADILTDMDRQLDREEWFAVSSYAKVVGLADSLGIDRDKLDYTKLANGDISEMFEMVQSADTSNNSALNDLIKEMTWIDENYLSKLRERSEIYQSLSIKEQRAYDNRKVGLFPSANIKELSQIDREISAHIEAFKKANNELVVGSENATEAANGAYYGLKLNQSTGQILFVEKSKTESEELISTSETQGVINSNIVDITERVKAATQQDVSNADVEGMLLGNCAVQAMEGITKVVPMARLVDGLTKIAIEMVSGESEYEGLDSLKAAGTQKEASIGILRDLTEYEYAFTSKDSVTSPVIAYFDKNHVAKVDSKEAIEEIEAQGYTFTGLVLADKGVIAENDGLFGDEIVLDKVYGEINAGEIGLEGLVMAGIVVDALTNPKVQSVEVQAIGGLMGKNANEISIQEIAGVFGISDVTGTSNREIMNKVMSRMMDITKEGGNTAATELSVELTAIAGGLLFAMKAQGVDIIGDLDQTKISGNQKMISEILKAEYKDNFAKSGDDDFIINIAQLRKTVSEEGKSYSAEQRNNILDILSMGNLKWQEEENKIAGLFNMKNVHAIAASA